MCPVCIATAALIAGKVSSAGGLTAVAIKKFGRKNGADNDSAAAPSKLSKNENATEEIIPNSNQRRD